MRGISYERAVEQLASEMRDIRKYANEFKLHPANLVYGFRCYLLGRLAGVAGVWRLILDHRDWDRFRIDATAAESEAEFLLGPYLND